MPVPEQLSPKNLTMMRHISPVGERIRRHARPLNHSQFVRHPRIADRPRLLTAPYVSGGCFEARLH
jgi:hypothetical protein